MQTVFLGSVVLFTAVAACFDLRVKRIPNYLTVPVMAAGFIFAVVRGAAVSGGGGAAMGAYFALGGFATGFGVLFVLWLIGGGGGGDVKFMGALGAWLGPWMTFEVLVISGLLAGAISMAVLAVQAVRMGAGKAQRRYLSSSHSQAKRQRRNSDLEKQERAVRRRLVPFAVPTALATWAVLIVTHFGLIR